MATSNLKIVIDAINQAQGDLNALRGQLAGLEDAGKKGGAGIGQTGASLGNLKAVIGDVTAGVAAFTGTWVAAMELGKQGAQLELNEQRFTRLAASIGTTADALKNRLGSATGGMLSDAKIVESATEIMSLGLAKDENSVVRLATLVTKLGWDMQQVIMTFANQSTMRLDALGLSVTDVTGRWDKFKASGMETGQAFNLAVLEAGEAKLKLLGDQSDSAAGSFARLDAAVANISDSVKSELAPGLANAAEALALLLTWNSKVSAATQQHAAEVARTSATYDAYIAEMQRTYAVTGQQLDAEGRLIDTRVEENNGLVQLTGAQIALTREQWESKRATDAMIAAGQNYAQVEQINTAALKQSAVAYNEMIRQRSAATASITADAIQLGDAERRRGEIEQQLAAIDKEIAANGPIRTISIRNEKMSTEELAVAQAKLAQATANLANIKRGEKETDADYAVRLTQAQAAVAELSTKLGEHTAVVGGATEAQIKQRDALQATLVEMQRTAEIDAAKSAFQALNDALTKGVLSENDYREAMRQMNDATGLFSSKALETATNSALMNAAIRGAKVPDDVINALLQYGGALGAAAQAQLAFGNVNAPNATLSTIEGAAPGMQHGGDFVVPAGYPNDTFPMRVSSGERVIVMPASGGNTNYHNSSFNTTINDPRTGAAFMAWLRQQQQPAFERG